MGSVKVWVIAALLWMGCVFSAYSQSAEVEQLLLNVEKLSQLKNILSDMKKGYEVLSTGYNSVRNIARGNFSLHEVFLNGLWLVSPEVRKYYKISEVVSSEQGLVLVCRQSLKRFSSGGSFSVSELDYFSRVYGKLLSESLDGLDELVMVITAGQLRMSDEERLSAIDRIHSSMLERLDFLRDFNKKAQVLLLQRAREKAEISSMEGYFKNN